jgi:hypothetical protein
VAVVSSVVWPVLQDFSSALEVALVLFSICMLLFSIFMILVFSLRYKFRPTGTSEPENAFIPEDFLDHGHPRKWEARRNEAPLWRRSGKNKFNSLPLHKLRQNNNPLTLDLALDMQRIIRHE